MNITKKRLNKIKKTKNQSKRVIHKPNKKNKKNKTIKIKKKAYNLKNKSFKLLKKRKRKYKGGTMTENMRNKQRQQQIEKQLQRENMGNKQRQEKIEKAEEEKKRKKEENDEKLKQINENKLNEEAKRKEEEKNKPRLYTKLWTPLSDIDGEFELWTPLDDIKFPNIDDEINTSIIRGDDGTSKKDSNSKKEEEVEQEEIEQEGEVEGEEKSSVMGKTKGFFSKKSAKMKGFFSKKSAKIKEYDGKEHGKLMEVLKTHENFKKLAEAIKHKILGNNESNINDEKINEFYFKIHYQLIKSNLFQTLASGYGKDENENYNFDVDNAVEYIANKFHENKDDKNIKDIINLFNDKPSEGNGNDGNGDVNVNGDENVGDGSNSNITGGGKNKLKKWIEDLKKDLKDAELGAHLKEVVRLPKKDLFLTLNFVEDTKENNENKNKPSRDVYMNTEATAATTQKVLDQLILELGEHILEAKKIKDGDKVTTSDTDEN